MNTYPPGTLDVKHASRMWEHVSNRFCSAGKGKMVSRPRPGTLSREEHQTDERSSVCPTHGNCCARNVLNALNLGSDTAGVSYQRSNESERWMIRGATAHWRAGVAPERHDFKGVGRKTRSLSWNSIQFVFHVLIGCEKSVKNKITFMCFPLARVQ